MTMPAHVESLADSFEDAAAEPSRESLARRFWRTLIEARRNQARAYLRAHNHLLDRLPDPSDR
jgi:hypothetical protein